MTKVQDLPLAEATVVALAEIFKALGDTTRVRMLDALARDEVCVCDLAGMLGLTESAVSHQLRLLRSLRLVKSRRDGRHIYYVLDDDHIAGLFKQGLEHVQERDDARLKLRAPLKPRAADATARRRAAEREAAPERHPRSI
jgi:ArsR family transcriptional regulator